MLTISRYFTNYWKSWIFHVFVCTYHGYKLSILHVENVRPARISRCITLFLPSTTANLGVLDKQGWPNNISKQSTPPSNVISPWSLFTKSGKVLRIFLLTWINWNSGMNKWVTTCINIDNNSTQVQLLELGQIWHNNLTSESIIHCFPFIHVYMGL